MSEKTPEVWFRETRYGVLYPVHWKAYASFFVYLMVFMALFLFLPVGAAAALSGVLFFLSIAVSAYHTRGPAEPDGGQ